MKRSTNRTETLKAYLFTIARNTFLERLGKAKRQVELEEVRLDPVPGSQEQTATHLRLLRVQGFLRSRPEIDRAAFVLRVQHELTCAEIARVLGLSLSAARVKEHWVGKNLLAAGVDKAVC